MDIDQRIADTEQKFNKLADQKSDIDTELGRLQGEWRLLQELKAPSVTPSVEVVDEGKSKKASKE